VLIFPKGKRKKEKGKNSVFSTQKRPFSRLCSLPHLEAAAALAGLCLKNPVMRYARSGSGLGLSDTSLKLCAP